MAVFTFFLRDRPRTLTVSKIQSRFVCILLVPPLSLLVVIYYKWSKNELRNTDASYINIGTISGFQKYTQEVKTIIVELFFDV